MNDHRLQQHQLGFLELVNKPSQQELHAYYEKRYYQEESASFQKKYSALELEVINLRIALRAQKIENLCVFDGQQRLLDVGCGEGFVLSYFKQQGWSVTGIDFSRAGVDQINPECAQFVEQGDVFKLLDQKIASQEQFDLVWLGNVLEHVLDPIGLLQSLRRLVAAKGLLLVTVPNDGNAYHEWLLQSGKIDSRWWIAIPDHISYFTAESLTNIAHATGWAVECLQADFPIDWYLAHPGSNFVADADNGAAAHLARLQFEQLIGAKDYAAANNFYEALAGVGLGRNLTAFLRLDSI